MPLEIWIFIIRVIGAWSLWWNLSVFISEISLFNLFLDVFSVFFLSSTTLLNDIRSEYFISAVIWNTINRLLSSTYKLTTHCFYSYSERRCEFRRKELPRHFITNSCDVHYLDNLRGSTGKREGRRVPLSRILQIAPLLLRNIPPKNKNGTKNNGRKHENPSLSLSLIDTDFPLQFFN